MNTTALTSLGQQTRVIQRSHPLLNVMAWELRRFCTSRLFWLQALGFFCLSSFVIWAQQIPLTLNHADAKVPFFGFVAGTSAWGLLMILPSGTLLLLGMLLPFVNADGVTRDLHRHTQELFMSTALPTWAYVWGRYLAGLVMSLGLALLLLAAILGMGGLLHLTIPAYPLPQISAVLLLWVGMVVSATVLVSSFGFALGTLLPRRTTLVKIVILVGWIVGAVILPRGLGKTIPPAWYVNWDPTSAITGLGMLPQYSFDLRAVTSAAQLQQLILTIENKMPDLAGWFAPHLLLAGCSLVLVLVAARAFKRSRDVLN
jgi:ABC-type transport system involved in multi-copper enzyme maturation permease subunit